MQFRGKKYEIYKDENKNIEIILAEFIKYKKFDILGEIGLNAINDENKIKQFIKYSKIFNYVQTNANENINDNFINKFCDKTGFFKENEKIIFLITDSKFKDIYKNLKESTPHKEMIKSNENINFILCYISNDLNEKIEYNETSFSSLKLKDNKKKLNEEINLFSFINSEDKFEIYIKIYY